MMSWDYQNALLASLRLSKSYILNLRGATRISYIAFIHFLAGDASSNLMLYLCGLTTDAAFLQEILR